MTSSASRRARRTESQGGSVQFRAWARGELARITPPGWSAKQVTPWKKTDAEGCRVCGAGVEWTMTMLTKPVPDRRIVFFAFALVCTKCVAETEKIRELGNRVLAEPA